MKCTSFLPPPFNILNSGFCTMESVLWGQCQGAIKSLEISYVLAWNPIVLSEVPSETFLLLEAKYLLRPWRRVEGQFTSTKSCTPLLKILLISRKSLENSFVFGEIYTSFGGMKCSRLITWVEISLLNWIAGRPNFQFERSPFSASLFLISDNCWDSGNQSRNSPRLARNPLAPPCLTTNHPIILWGSCHVTWKRWFSSDRCCSCYLTCCFGKGWEFHFLRFVENLEGLTFKIRS